MRETTLLSAPGDLGLSAEPVASAWTSTEWESFRLAALSGLQRALMGRRQQNTLQLCRVRRVRAGEGKSSPLADLG